MRLKLLFLLICIFVANQFAAMAQPKSLVINTKTTVAPIQSTMWGLFFEDINFAADGGIYAELIKNCSFEFYKPLMGMGNIWGRVCRSISGS